MADPISIIALAGTVLATCYSFGCGVANAPVEAKRLAAEVTNLSGMIVGLQGLLHQNEAVLASLKLPEALSDCATALDMVSTMLEPHLSGGRQTKSFRVANRLLWPFKKPDTLAMLAIIERQKSSLGLILGTFTSRTLSDQAHLLEDVASSVERVQTMMISEQETREKQAVLDWLSTYDHEAQHLRASKIRASNTCSWILEHPKFVAWTESEERVILWYYGMAGAGKTTVASFIIDYLQALLSTQDAAFGYFYYDASISQSLSLETFLGSILRQVYSRSKVPAWILERFEATKGSTGIPKKPSLHLLQEMFQDLVDTHSANTLVIDGIDEAEDPFAVFHYLGSLKNPRSHEMRVFTTSRPEIGLRIDNETILKLHAPESSIDLDIRSYVSARMESDARLSRLKPEMQGHIERTLTGRAHGMFRWVQCQLDDIARLRTDKAIKAALATLPKSLESSYERVLTKINDYDIPLARHGLLWMTHGLYPLTLDEMAEAVLIEPDLHEVDDDNRLNDPLDLVDICGTLVSLFQKSQKLRLAHHSVREYLIRLPPKSPFCLETSDSHHLLAELCLSYLLMDVFKEPTVAHKQNIRETFTKYPLLLYAAQNWPGHVRRSKRKAELEPTILKLLTAKPSPNFLTWIGVIMYHSRPDAGPGHELESGPTYTHNPEPLYYAASYGLHYTCESLIAQGAEVNAKAGRFGGTALHAACFRSHAEIVQQLLQAGADPSIQDHIGMTAFELADYVGFEEGAQVGVGYEDVQVQDEKVETSLKALYSQPPSGSAVRDRRRVQTVTQRSQDPRPPSHFREVNQGAAFELE